MSDASNKNAGRLMSLDALRGFDMIWIIGLAGAVRALCGAFPGGDGFWLARQMHHCQWEGFAFYDLIFPLFLFMAGVSFPFSYASQKAKGVSMAAIHLRLLKRVAVLVALQLVQSGALWLDPAKYTYPSVLVRIALPWFLAALVYMHAKPRVRVTVAVATVALFWAVLEFWHPPGAGPEAGNYSPHGGIVDYLDGFLSLRAYLGMDPFEVRDIPLSLFSVPLALAGMFAGDMVAHERNSARTGKTALLMALVGVALSIAGVVLSLEGSPMVKNLSTPSFMLFSGGLCFILFAAFYWIVDVLGFVRWTFPLRVIGMNSIAAYLSGYFFDFMKPSSLLLGGIASMTPCPAFVLQLGALGCCWLVLYVLYKAGIFLKA